MPFIESSSLSPKSPRSSKRSSYNSVIILLTTWIDTLPYVDGRSVLSQAVENALNTSGRTMLERLAIRDEASFLDFADSLLRWIPTEDMDGKRIYNILVAFGFIFCQHPLSQHQTPVHPDSSGKDLTFLSSWLLVFAQCIGLWLDNPASITDESLATFAACPKYRAHEWLVPAGGFKTFNDFFHRHLIPGARPIANPEDNATVVFPADCTFEVAYLITQDGSVITSADRVNVKGLSWELKSLLQGSKYADQFAGGVWTHAFLNTYNYHRQHAPVAGKVLEASVIQGAAYLDVVATPTECPRSDALVANNWDGYQFLQTRGMVIIDGGPIGLVAVLPIGMAQVSGIILSVKAGETVTKGQEISYFRFGGSDCVLVFQKKSGLTVDSFKHLPTNDWSMMGSRLATAPGKDIDNAHPATRNDDEIMPEISSVRGVYSSSFSVAGYYSD